MLFLSLPLAALKRKLSSVVRVTSNAFPHQHTHRGTSLLSRDQVHFAAERSAAGCQSCGTTAGCARQDAPKHACSYHSTSPSCAAAAVVQQWAHARQLQTIWQQHIHVHADPV